MMLLGNDLARSNSFTSRSCLCLFILQSKSSKSLSHFEVDSFEGPQDPSTPKSKRHKFFLCFSRFRFCIFQNLNVDVLLELVFGFVAATGKQVACVELGQRLSSSYRFRACHFCSMIEMMMQLQRRLFMI